MELINRNEIFQKNPNITNLIISFQKVINGEDNFEEVDEMFDAINLPSNKSKNTGFNLMLFHENIDTYSGLLSLKLKELLGFLKTENLILISHLKIDYFGNLEHDYEKVKNAYALLKGITKSNSFKEAITTKVSKIDILVEIFFWLERCDGSIPEYIFWVDENDRFCFYLCKYGNIHFVNFTEGDLISENMLLELGFAINEDFDQFSKSSRIDNRKIKL